MHDSFHGMPFWTLARLAAALDGADPAVGAPPVGGRAPIARGWDERPLRAIATDTRDIQLGDAFVALKGERFDAHDFLTDAVAKGAAAVVVSDASKAAHLGVPVLVVDDTLTALGRLGRYRRRAWGRPVVAIGGSNGKTSTKALVTAALSARLRVHATAGNLNNQIGVPLTLLAIPDDCDIAVVEMGTSLPGEMAILRDIGVPDLVVITSIGEEHLEGLGSLDGVLTEEAALAEGAAVVIAPASEETLLARIASHARRVVTVGLTAGDVTAERSSLEPDGRGSLTVAGTTVVLPLVGEHNLRNAMLAVAVAIEAGIPAAEATAALARTAPPAMRSAAEPLGRARLINDAYNANPPSMRSALALLDAVGDGRQRVAVLGTMRELGAQAQALHAEIAQRALASRAAVIAGVGEMADALAAAAPGDPRVIVAPDPDALWPLLEPRLDPEALILLKASRGVRLERIVPLLAGWSARQQ